MKRTKLVVEFEYDFKLFGLISSAREHKLAWEINQSFNINLKKNEDIKINFLDNENLIISNFLFEKEESILRLLKNKSVLDNYSSGNKNLYLISELKQFDYLIIIDGFEQTFSKDRVMNRMGAIEVIQYCVNLDLNKLKSKENLVF